MESFEKMDLFSGSKTVVPMRSFLHYTLISILIVLSFFCYSSNFYPLLNSDDAIQVLMIHNFQLPHDLYFWGQDRYGSLIPLLGQIFHNGFGLSPLTSESITHYLLLIAGYFAFATFFKSKFSRLILAIAWFFPPLRVIDLLRLNIGEEYSLLAIGIYFINTINNMVLERYKLKHHLFLLCISLLFILATWVSDLAIVSIFLIIVLQVHFEKARNNTTKNILFKWKPGIYYLVGGFIIGITFIFYGKYYADKSPEYISFNDFNTTIASIGIFGDSIFKLLMFKASEPFTSVNFYLLIILTLTLFVFRSKIRFNENQKKWFLFFVLDFMLIFMVIMISKWAFTNGIPRRYFTSNYIMFWLAFLLAFEYFAESNLKKMLQVVLLVAVIIGGAGSLYNLKYIWPKTLKPRAEYAREFESLGRIGIIGNYWNSYINSVTNPDQVIATPDDRSSVRNRQMAYEVMKRDTVYIIRDGWFDVFPDSLNQFGTPLYKNGEEFRMGDSFVCRYRK